MEGGTFLHREATLEISFNFLSSSLHIGTLKDFLPDNQVKPEAILNDVFLYIIACLYMYLHTCTINANSVPIMIEVTFKVCCMDVRSGIYSPPKM